MSPRTRRSALAAVGVAAASLAGCARDAGPRSSGGDPRTTPTPPATTTDATSNRHLLLDPVTPADEVDAATVYPRRLRGWLREAATTDATLRVRASVPQYRPVPVLPAFDRVRLSSPDGAADGVYEVHAEGGTYYEWRVGAAEATDVPDDADVTPVAALSGERRTLVERALRPDGTLVSPETALGSWVRHEFLGGYVSRGGVTYRGRKLRRTDAALFSRSVWLVLSLSRVAPSDASADVALSLAPVPDAVRRVVDGLVGDDDRPEENRAELGSDADAVARFARETDALLFHAAAYEVRVGGAASP